MAWVRRCAPAADAGQSTPLSFHQRRRYRIYPQRPPGRHVPSCQRDQRQEVGVKVRASHVPVCDVPVEEVDRAVGVLHVPGVVSDHADRRSFGMQGALVHNSIEG